MTEKCEPGRIGRITARGTALLGQGGRDPVTILRDRGGDGLPIFRTAPDDPDDESTLATAVFRVTASGVAWNIRKQGRASPVHAGTVTR